MTCSHLNSGSRAAEYWTKQLFNDRRSCNRSHPYPILIFLDSHFFFITKDESQFAQIPSSDTQPMTGAHSALLPYSPAQPMALLPSQHWGDPFPILCSAFLLSCTLFSPPGANLPPVPHSCSPSVIISLGTLPSLCLPTSHILFPLLSSLPLSPRCSTHKDSLHSSNQTPAQAA